MAELSNWGKSIGERIGSARNLPAATATATRSAASGWTDARILSRASSSDNMPRSVRRAGWSSSFSLRPRSCENWTVQRAICVFSSSSDAVAPHYVELAQSFGALLARRHMGLVYGAGRVGLMGVLARAVHAHGGRVIGVIPDFLRAQEVAYEEADELIVTRDLRERKAIMESRYDAFVALPGGFGTLEEILEILTLKQLATHAKPVVFLNT